MGVKELKEVRQRWVWPQYKYWRTFIDRLMSWAKLIKLIKLTGLHLTSTFQFQWEKMLKKEKKKKKHLQVCLQHAGSLHVPFSSSLPHKQKSNSLIKRKGAKGLHKQGTSSNGAAAPSPLGSGRQGHSQHQWSQSVLQLSHAAAECQPAARQSQSLLRLPQSQFVCVKWHQQHGSCRAAFCPAPRHTARKQGSRLP